MRAIFLAGGKGTRLRSVVSDVPKPMAPIEGRPFLELLLRYAIAQGVNEIILSVGYKHEAIVHHLGNSLQKVPIHYVVEGKPLGTGGALKHALKEMSGDDPCFVFNADTLAEFDMYSMYRAYVESGADVGMLIRYEEEVTRFGKVKVDMERRRIVGLAEKTQMGGGYVNAGVYLIKPRLFERFTMPEVFSLERDFLAAKAADLFIMPWITRGYFIDIGIPETYKKAQSELVRFLQASRWRPG